MSWLIQSTDPLLLNTRVNTLVAELDPAGFNTMRLNVQQSTLAAISAAAMASPMLGTHRVVVLEQIISARAASQADTSSDEDDDGADAGGKVPWADLRALLQQLPPTAAVIIAHGSVLANGHYVQKALRALDWTIEAIQPPSGDQLLQWVQTRVQDEGGRATARPIQTLLNRLFPETWRGATRGAAPPDLTLLANEIAKLVTAAGDDVIDDALIESLVADRSESRPFKLADAMYASSEDALRELLHAQESGDPSEMLLPQVASDLGVTTLAKLGASAQLTPIQMSQALGTSPQRVGTLLQRRRAVSPQALQRGLERLRAADAGIKRGRLYDAQTAMTPLVAESAADLGAPRARQGRQQTTRRD